MKTKRRSFLLAVASLLWPIAATSADAQVLPLALELDGTRVTLGSVAEFVVRTTEARPLSSAGFGFEVRDRDGQFAVAFAALDSFELLSGGGDATIDATFDTVTQRLAVNAVSPGATLNDEYGPLAVFRFTLDPAVQEGDRFEIWLDPDTALLDPLTQPVVSAVGRADFRIVEDEPGQGLGALGGEAYPGAQVVIGAVTERPFAIGGGTIELFYDATLFAAGFQVLIDARYGSATLDVVANPTPGHLVIDFTSPGDDLNLDLHGPFLTVELQALETVAVGTLTTVLLGPATELLDPAGDPILLETDGEELEFIDPEIIADAAFEAGGFEEWWVVVQ